MKYKRSEKGEMMFREKTTCLLLQNELCPAQILCVEVLTPTVTAPRGLSGGN